MLKVNKKFKCTRLHRANDNIRVNICSYLNITWNQYLFERHREREGGRKGVEASLGGTFEGNYKPS